MGLPSNMQRGEIRIGTAEREAAAARLSEHFAAGRLDSTEFEERIHLAYQARTTGDLRRLFVDLPEPEARSAGRPARRRDHSFSAIFVILILAVLVVGAFASRFPPFFVVPLVWFVFARGFGGWHRRWR
jgi:Domain of unknown function (DUF1707)